VPADSFLGISAAIPEARLYTSLVICRGSFYWGVILERYVKAIDCHYAIGRFPGLSLRAMDPADLPGVMEIESSAYEFPWTEGIFRDCMRVGYACWVDEFRGSIRGYGVISITVRECHILNLCIEPHIQGHGLGRKILHKMLSVARQNDADTAILEVRPSNQRAIALYLSEGFCEVGRRQAYYPAKKGREDALILAKMLR
jgi:ribosomal-protein-alanine N-acetyltransferase